MIWVPRLGFPLVATAFVLTGAVWWLAENNVLAGALLLWPAMNLTLMGLAYLGLGARVWGKNDAGVIALWSHLFWFPARIAMGVWTAWKVRNQSEPFQKLSEGIWVGRRIQSAEQLGRFSSVLDLASEFPAAGNTDSYLAIRMMDGAPPDPRQEEELIGFMREAPRPLLIHCAKGKGRTGTIAVWWLMREGQEFTQALRLAKECRPELRVQAAQETWLERS